MNVITMNEAVRRIHNLPSLPQVIMELLDSIDRFDINIDELAEKISGDQALTAKVLRLANSTFYGMAQQVTTIPEAIAILGFRTVRSIATTAALVETFATSAHGGFNIRPFWRHAIAAAVCAKEIAPFLEINPDYAYTAGLLHDIGRLVLLTQFQTTYETVMTHRHQQDCRLVESETEVLGLDHAALGYELARHWKFPEAMQRAVAQHHAKSAAGLSPLSLTVIAADLISHALGTSSDEDDSVPAVPEGLWNLMGIDEENWLLILQKTERQLEDINHILNA